MESANHRGSGGNTDPHVGFYDHQAEKPPKER
jgi:hypothetical protein